MPMFDHASSETDQERRARQVAEGEGADWEACNGLVVVVEDHVAGHRLILGPFPKDTAEAWVVAGRSEALDGVSATVELLHGE